MAQATLAERVRRDVGRYRCTDCGLIETALEFVTGLGDLECPRCGALREKIAKALRR
jgi:predicted nucleic acid-binding Zn ribbon protein